MPFAQYQDAVAHPQNLWEFRRDHHHGYSLAGHLMHQIINFDFSANVYTAGWLIHNQYFGLYRQPFGDNDLLLVAAAQIAGRCSMEGVRMFSCLTYWLIAQRLFLNYSR